MLVLAGPLVAQPVTFGESVRPILERRCQPCHRAGEIGKMPLGSYAEVRPWAKAIREAVLQRRMPPWFRAGGTLSFANDPSLSAAEMAAIDDWVRAGAPQGKPTAALPAAPHASRGDVTLTMPRPIPVPARGELDYQWVLLPLGLAEDKWVAAAEIRPSARGVVHHAVAYIREPGDTWFQENLRTATKADILALYAPGQPPMQCPPGMARKVPAGSDIALQLHYTPNGTAVEDRTSISLHFTARPEHRVHTLQINSTDFRIPPGDPSYRVSASGTLPNDALLLSLFPHMHLRGKAFEYSLVEPGGRVETLLRVAPYDFHWQLDYRLAAPRRLKKGTRLRCDAWYDNSPNNPRNPDPSAEVGYGEPSTDEMMVGFFDVALPADVDKKSFFVR